MESQFTDEDANAWFRRNNKSVEQGNTIPYANPLLSYLEPFKNELSRQLEVGCSSGVSLSTLSGLLDCEGFGIDPSYEAIEYGKERFPKLNLKQGYGHNLPFEDEFFDFVFLGFFLYCVPRSAYLRTISEADRVLKTSGFLGILDFDVPYPYSNPNKHNKGLFSYKINNARVFESTGLFSLVGKSSFSHAKTSFSKEIDERVSLQLLYKEDKAFTRG